jgi:hypothetical protein
MIANIENDGSLELWISHCVISLFCYTKMPELDLEFFAHLEREKLSRLFRVLVLGV